MTHTKTLPLRHIPTLPMDIYISEEYKMNRRKERKLKRMQQTMRDGDNEKNLTTCHQECRSVSLFGNTSTSTTTITTRDVVFSWFSP